MYTSTTISKDLPDTDTEVSEQIAWLRTAFQITAPLYFNPVFARSVLTCGAWKCCENHGL